ncbi:MAG: restriction endonuclease subunit S [Candidatus Thiodiazotropha lotti]|nr:restriction endonuclease subunit S [Candidatus Thiodiazotropha lotti]
MWKIAHACPYVASGTTPKSDSDFYYIGGENLWVTTGELRENIVTDTQKKVTNQALIDMPTLRLHPKGSVAIAMYGATIGRLGIFGSRATTNQACCVMPPSKVLHNKYLFYWLYATRQEIINLSSGGGQPNVNQEKIASLKVSSPNFNTQSLIANFLDHETAKIDTLIEKQQQLIKLLKEKRQAVISHAVTKGLTNLPGANLNSSSAAGPKGEGRDSPSNPDAPMRDSGVEWLGEVPEGWGIVRLKRLARKITDGEHISPTFTEEGMPFLSAKDIRERTINYDVDKFVVLEDGYKFRRRCNPDVGDILIVSRGATIGRVGLVEDDIVFCLLGSVILLKPKKNYVDPVFVYYMLNQDLAKEQFFLASQASAQQAIYLVDVAELIVTLPPLVEQVCIRNHLEKQVGKIDNLIKEAEKVINLLQERRTALISAAVTGKIDVRDWAAPEQHNKEDAA